MFCSSFPFLCDLFYVKIKTLIQHPKCVLVSWVKVTKWWRQKESSTYWKKWKSMWSLQSKRHKGTPHWGRGTIGDNATKVRESSMTPSPVTSIRTWRKEVTETQRLKHVARRPKKEAKAKNNLPRSQGGSITVHEDLKRNFLNLELWLLLVVAGTGLVLSNIAAISKPPAVGWSCEYRWESPQRNAQQW